MKTRTAVGRTVKILREIRLARADEAEEIAKGFDCVCAEYWAGYNQRDPNCSAHDEADRCNTRAAELRRLAGGKHD
jgi:hypothetical protein